MEIDLEDGVSRAVTHFWRVRTKQDETQGSVSGARDAGNRSAVTGGKQLDGFTDLLRTILLHAGLPEVSIHTRSTTLPGYYRSSKDWDVVVSFRDNLVAAIEFKSHVGPSFGNNFNNRVEEALGNSIDLLDAYRHGVYQPSMKPWIGWLMLLEDTEKSNSPVRIRSEHFPVTEEFRDASYAKRYEIFCRKLVRESRYDAACLLLSDKENGLIGEYSEPNMEIGFKTFAISLYSHASSISMFG